MENVLSERDQLERVADLLGGTTDGLDRRVTAMVEENRELRRQLDRAAAQQGASEVDRMLERAADVEGIQVVAGRVEAPDVTVLRSMADRLRDKLQRGIGVLGMEHDGKAMLLCVVTDDLVDAGWKAGPIVNRVAEFVGGRGGGKPHLAQAGGPEVGSLNEALEAVPDIVRASKP
jgi:alanyl-tRNA synthetase